MQRIRMQRMGAVLLCLAAGCGGDGAPIDQVGTFTITEVTVEADGREDVRMQKVTLADLQARGALPRAGGRHASDYGAGRVPCSGSSTNVYDDTLANCGVAGCNAICFNISGPTGYDRNVYLGNYCVNAACQYSWNSRVRAWYSGGWGARLQRSYPGTSWPYCSQYFIAAYKYGDADTCGKNTNYLYFSDPIQ